MHNIQGQCKNYPLSFYTDPEYLALLVTEWQNTGNGCVFRIRRNSD